MPLTKMEYNYFGSSDLVISRLGFGCSRFTGDDLEDAAGLERCAALVQNAVNEGINLFDVAPAYARGKAEHILGMVSKNCPDSFHINAKSLSYDDPGADDVRRRLEHSLCTMNVDKVTFYTMWSVKNRHHYAQVMKRDGPFDGAVRAKDEGLVKKILISCHCDNNLVYEIISEGCFDGIIISHNILSSAPRDGNQNEDIYSKVSLINYAGLRGLGVFIMNPLAGGVVLKNPAIFGVNALENSYAYLLQNPYVTSVLSRIKQRDELLENIAVTKRVTVPGYPQYSPTFFLKGTEAFCTNCRYCTGCPAGIPVNRYMSAYNRMLLLQDNESGTVQGAPEMFDFLLQEGMLIPGNADNSCKKCGTCERKCTQDIDIIVRLEKVFSLAKVYGFCQDAVEERLAYLLRGRRIGIYPTSYHTQKLVNYLDNHPVYSCMIQNGELEMVFFDDSVIDGRDVYFHGQRVHPLQNLPEFDMDRVIISDFHRVRELYEQVSALCGCSATVLPFYKLDSSTVPEPESRFTVRLF